jgi:hypothetical protein
VAGCCEYGDEPLGSCATELVKSSYYVCSEKQTEPTKRELERHVELLNVKVDGMHAYFYPLP